MALYNEAYAKHNSGLSNQIVRAHESRYVLQALAPQRHETILEIGCNSGRFVELLRKYTDNVIGVDINEQAIKSSSVSGLYCMSAESLDLPDNYADKVVCLHTIEHLKHPKRAVEEMVRVTKPNGRIVLTYPMEPIRGLTCLLSAMKAHGNPLKARDMHVHKFFPRKIEALFEATGAYACSSRLIFAPLPVFLTCVFIANECLDNSDVSFNPKA
jgi:ubiquinone/menaquinone biosynthesis C-methylase UbiE